MGRLRSWACGLALSLVLLAQVGAPTAAHAGGRGHVYLMRGIFGVSVGLDALAGKLSRMGFATSVHAHGDAGTVAETAIRDYKSGRVRSIVLIGHSLGAGAVVSVARELEAAKIPVALLISLDPVFELAVSSNVRRAVNYYVAGSGLPLGKAPGFRGSLTNTDLSKDPDMGHMAVQSAAKMHARMIASVRGALGGAGAAPAAKKDGQGAARPAGEGASVKPPGGA